MVGMKSAYELAMERLEKNAPTRKLTEAQKARIAEIESQAKAKLAERELLLGAELEKARAKGDVGEVAALEKQLASERKRIESDAEEKKERVRAEE